MINNGNYFLGKLHEAPYSWGQVDCGIVEPATQRITEIQITNVVKILLGIYLKKKIMCCVQLTNNYVIILLSYLDLQYNYFV